MKSRAVPSRYQNENNSSYKHHVIYLLTALKGTARTIL